MRHAAAIRTRSRSAFALASLVLLLDVTQVASAAPRSVERQSAPWVATSRLDRQRPPLPRIQRWATPRPHPPFGILFSRLRIRVTAVTASSISVAWSGLPGRGAVYRVFQDGVPVVWTSNDGYTFTGLSCETSYVLGVAAFRAHGRLPVAAVAIGARTAACPAPPPDTAAPSTPDNVHIAATTASSITIAWDASKDDVGVAGYGVYNGVTRIDSTTATSYTFEKLACASGFTLAVDAYDAAGNRSATASVAATTDSCPLAEPPAIAGQGYRVAFADEFNSLDRSVWDDHIWYDESPSPAWTNFQYVDQGVLHLVSSKSFACCSGEGYPINTMTTLSSGKTFVKGYFEARMKWAGGGHGAWPAFWLTSYRHATDPVWPQINPYCALNGLPQALCYGSELDVMDEGGLVSDHYFALHRNPSGDYGAPNQSVPAQGWINLDRSVDLSANWHTYAALWTDTTVTWYLDDGRIASGPVLDSTNQPMFLLLQNWTHNGCWDCGATNGTDTDVQVDYVRVWQK
jgi:beta-glucanase (GH16 family)